MSFLVLSFRCLRSSCVNFKSGLEYLTKGTAHVFIPLIGILLFSSLSSSFLVLLRYLFKFYFISTCLIVSASNFPNYLHVYFLRAFWFFLNFFLVFLSPCGVSRFSLLAWHIFLGLIPSVYLVCILEFPILFRFLQTAWCRPCTLGV